MDSRWGDAACEENWRGRAAEVPGIRHAEVPDIRLYPAGENKAGALHDDSVSYEGN